MRIDDIKISEEIYIEIRSTAIRLWRTHEDNFGYVTEKVNSISSLPNSPQNVAKIIRMFDHWHQKAIAGRVSKDAKHIISTCIKAGWPKQTIGRDLENNPFFKV